MDAVEKWEMGKFWMLLGFSQASLHDAPGPRLSKVRAFCLHSACLNSKRESRFLLNLGGSRRDTEQHFPIQFRIRNPSEIPVCLKAELSPAGTNWPW